MVEAFKAVGVTLWAGNVWSSNLASRIAGFDSCKLT